MNIEKLDIELAPYESVSRDTIGLINDPAALGLWVYLISRPKDWVVRKQQICKHFGIGEHKYKSCMKVLTDLGLTRLSVMRDEKGRCTGKTRKMFHLPKRQENHVGATQPTSGLSDSAIFRPSENQPIYLEDKKIQNIDKDKTHKIYVKQAEIDSVFLDWREILDHPRARLDSKRKKTIQTALSLRYTVEDCRKAFVGCKRSAHHQGFNTAGKKYDSLTLILKDADNIERFMKYADDPPKPFWPADNKPEYAVIQTADAFYRDAIREAGQDKTHLNTVIEGKSERVVQARLL